MRVTEAEALHLWCPFARVGHNGDPGINRLTTMMADDKNFTCLGSNCALWQWADDEYEHTNKSMSNTQAVVEQWEKIEGATIIATWRRPKKDRKGYCGLGRSG